jgi:putative oxidoreductase
MWLKGRAGTVILWMLTIFGTLTMGLAGLSKFTNQSQWQGRFVAWGYPAWFASFIGGLEMLAAASLLVPRVAPYAACTLVAVMLGALYTVLTRVNDVGWHAALMQLAVMSAIAALRFWREAGAQPTPRHASPDRTS